MAFDIKVPVVGESITEVTVAQWIKKEGDFVDMDDVICELESDKATFELNAETSGNLKILVPEGETISIGTVLCQIDESASKPKTEQTNKSETSHLEKEKETAMTGNKIEMKVPTVGESITEVTISTWTKEDGSFVELDEVIAEIDSDKATFELTAEATGKLKHVAKAGDTIEIGSLICTIEEMSSVPAKEKEKATESPDSVKRQQADTSYTSGHPSPAAAKILDEKGIAPSAITGTGPGGRILKEDAVKATPQSSQKAPVAQPATPETKQSVNRNQRRQKLSQLRKTVSRRLVAVKNETAMLTTFNEVNMKPIMDLRKKYKDKFKEKYDVGLGFMSFFTKAICIALQEWPAVNAMIDGEEMVYNDFCDISIAVSAPKGLVVPVVRNAEKLTFAEIEKEILDLATKARDNKLSIEEMTGGTFTITNGGVFGSMMSTPIINAPQSAILGMHNIVERPVVELGEIVVRPIMYVALSYDHRIIDGRESVSFLVRVKELLEDPSRLLLEI